MLSIIRSWSQDGRILASGFYPAGIEMTILFAAFTAVLGMLLLNGLPSPYHPVFNVPRFHLASPRLLSLDQSAR